MNKKKIKYPDGGPLLSYTTGTPEYEAYLAKQKAYNNFLERERSYSGYGDFKIVSDAEYGAIQPRMVSPNTTASGYRVYNTKLAPSVVGKDEYYVPETGAYYVPYYDAPTEATIEKSQAELDAEKQKAENEAFAKQYQGYILNSNDSVQNEDGTWSKVNEATPLPVGKEVPTDGTFHSSLPAGAVVKYAGGGNLDASTLASLASAIPQQNTQMYGEPMQGEQVYEGAKQVVKSIPGPIGAFATGFDAISKAIPGIASNFTPNDPMKGATIAEGFSDPFKSQMKLMQNDDATGLQKALGLLPMTSGFINNKIAHDNINEDRKNAFLDKSYSMGGNFNLPTFPFGGDVNNSNKRKQSGFTLRPNKYGEQNWFESSKQGLMDLGLETDLPLSGQTEKIGLFNSIGRAMDVNKNTRDTGRDISRVKLNAFVDRTTNDIPAFGCGGSMKKYEDGGEFIEYNGPDHSNGGVPVDQNGQPTIPQNAQAEVEGGETLHDDGIDKYIFSDRLVVEPKSKTTFADMSKKINNKYKGDNLDKFQKEARDLELNRLKQEQEMFKSTIAGNQTEQPVMAKGGYIPKYPDGGIIPYSPELLNEMQYGNIERLPMNSIQGISTNYNSDLPINLLPISRLQNNQTKIIPTSPISELPLNIQMQYGNVTKLPINNINSITNPHFINSINGNNSGLQTIPEANFDDFTLDAPIEYKSYLEDIKASSNNKQDKTSQEDILPQDKINPLGFVASNIGNAYDLYNANKPAKENKFAKVSQEGINLESQRRELEKQAALSKDINRENVRSLATSSGQALGNQIVANALINSNLSSGLSQSFLNEATTNTGIRNQENLANTEIRNQEIIADQMDKAKRESTTSQALHSTGMNTQSYLRDLKSADVGNENNKMWFDAINNSSKYFVIGTDANGNKVFQAKDGSNKIITKPKND